VKYGVISDVHANHEALDAVFACLDRAHVDRVICLGDIVGYHADPNVCVARVRARCDVVLAGNHDRAAVGTLDPGDFPYVARRAIAWTRRVLRRDHAEYLEALPIFRELDAESDVRGGRMKSGLLAETERSPEHRARPDAPDQRSEGSAESDVRGGRMKSGLLAETERSPGHRAKPDAPDQRSEGSAESDVRGGRMKSGLLAETWLVHGSLAPAPNDRFHISNTARVTANLRALAASSARLCWFGHTHKPAVHAWQANIATRLDPPSKTGELVLPECAHVMINPGSVGQPRDGDWRAAYAVYDTDARRVAFHRVEYDRDACMRHAQSAGLLDGPSVIRRSVELARAGISMLRFR
jgi:predicted phosphodiesterase